MSSLNRRILLVTVTTLMAVALSLAVEMALSLRTRWSFAHSGHGHILGWIGLILILLTFVYPWKKSHRTQEIWPKNWFTLHMAAGVTGPMLVFVHSGWHLHAVVPLLTLAAMIAVVVSGIIGKTIHHVAVRMLSDQQRELVRQGLSQAQIEREVYEIAAQEETFRVWQIIHAPMAFVFIALLLLHIVGALYYGGL